MNRTIHKKLTSKGTFIHVEENNHETNGSELYSQRWERKIAVALKADYLKPRSKAIENILELAKTI